ncbi:hypothetical protein [Pseudofulvibacter geojedonensis]|uniref:Uncharacterized protein n=1 Tax=Pseudofulvibacter geojedonensis TaxID=1123758 RepID=A0ABW3HYA4_9FLAO
MISIFNKKLEVHINISDVDWIKFTPREYEDIPNVIIEMKNGFDFIRHSQTCDECRKFVSALATNSLDWYISYNDKIKRLDLSTLNSKEYYNNHLTYTNSDYNYGTTIKLIIHPLSTDKVDIENYLQELLEREDYETACLIRDLTPIE